MADDDQKPWEKYQKKAAAAAAPPPGGKPWPKYQAPAAAPPVAAAKPQGVPTFARKCLRRTRASLRWDEGATTSQTSWPAPCQLRLVWGAVCSLLPWVHLEQSPARPREEAAAGDRLRRSIYEGMYKNLEPETVGSAATSTAEQGLLGGFSEGQAQTVNYLAQPLLRNLAVTRQILKEADATGTNVRLTSGEARRLAVAQTRGKRHCTLARKCRDV